MSSIEGFTAENVRDNVLPRVLLARSVTARLRRRLRRANDAVDRARDADDDARVFAWAAAISQLWTLVENVLKLYELIAERVDVRYAGKRRGLDSRFLRERIGDRRIEFHRRVWMFDAFFETFPDEVFRSINIDPADVRRLFPPMIDRSIAYLTTSEDAMRRFYHRYRAVMNAYKHGRALFALAPEITATGITLSASFETATAIIGETLGAVPNEFVTMRVDDELRADVDEVIRLLAVQLPKFHTFFSDLTAAVDQFLLFLMGDPAARRPVLTFSFFADPYSAEESALLERVRAAAAR